MTPPSADPTRARPSILSPTLDLLSVGGLSILLFVPLLLSGRTDLVLVGIGAQAWLATLINMPHFMASYRIVYRDRATILKHKWASIWVPAILLVYTGLAVWEAQYSTVLVTLLVTVSGAYLAWHYTAQVWGMMASFAYLDGRSFDPLERRLVRASLIMLLAWQVSWFLLNNVRDRSLTEPLYTVISLGTVVAFVVGAIGLEKMRRRTGRFPPARALVAWLALFAWYAVLARDPKAIFWIQLAHALQYLAFPIRVEINRTARGVGRAATGDGAGKTARHMAIYGVAILAASYLAGVVLPASAMSAVGVALGDDASRVTPVLILMFINIHHYFTDGVIWKLRNPDVRKELFAHVSLVPATAAAGGRGRSRRG